MKKSYFALAASARQLGLTALLAAGATLAAHAQFSYSVTGAANTTSTYTDLTTGTVISTVNNDDANSAAQNIGFSFSYNGTAFTQFVLNTNGLMRLGAAAPSAALAASPYAQAPELSPVNSTNAADVNLLMPFNFDLTAGTSTPEFRVATTGTAPNRVCTIQWKNMADKAVATDASTPATISTQYTNMAFQVKLYETTNVIEFVYNSATVGAAAATALKYAVVGIKGSTSSASVLGTKISSSAWSTTTFATGPQLDAFSANAHNFRSTFAPDAGRTYRFSPATANDAAVRTIYTLGKLALGVSQPHSVQAVVTNRGTAALTNLAVTLNVTGANTFTDTKTVTSLAAGASSTVTFTAYPASLTAGTNNLTVSVPNDDNNTNNTQTYTQQITTNQVLIADATVGAIGTLSYSSSTAGGVLASKFTASGTNPTVSNAVFYFGTGSTATTQYQAVLYSANAAGTAPGTVLYTSATQTRPSAGGAATVAMGNTVVPATYFIGIKEVGTTGAGLGTQPEDPLRTGTFVVSADGTTWVDLATNASFQVRLLIESNVTATPAAATGDAAVTTLYTLGKLSPLALPHTVQARVSNAGTTALTNLPVTLTVAGANTFTDTKTVASLAAGASTIVTFTAYPSATLGTNNLTVSVPTDAVNTNNTQTYTQQVTTDRLLVADPALTNTTSVSYSTSTAGGALVSKFTTSTATGTTANNLTSATLYFGTNSTATTAYQVVAYDATGTGGTPGAVLYTSATQNRPTAGGAVTLTLPANTQVPATFYLGAKEIGTTGVGLASQPESPLRTGTFYYSANGTTGWTDVATSTLQVRILIEAGVTARTLATSPELQRALTVYPNPSTSGVFTLDVKAAGAATGLGLEVTNQLGQRVYTGSARDNFATQLDLSNLAPGIYHLTVRNGSDYSTTNLSIVK